MTARGFANTATNTPMRTNMVEPIGSITKSFAATMVLQLVDEKKLTLDDTLGHWYPEIPEAWAITVRMLLTVSSAIADYTNTNVSTFCAMPTKEWGPDELIALGVGAPRPFDPPGSAYNYSTTNTVLLGRSSRRSPVLGSGCGLSAPIDRHDASSARCAERRSASSSASAANDRE